MGTFACIHSFCCTPILEFMNILMYDQVLPIRCLPYSQLCRINSFPYGKSVHTRCFSQFIHTFLRKSIQNYSTQHRSRIIRVKIRVFQINTLIIVIRVQTCIFIYTVYIYILFRFQSVIQSIYTGPFGIWCICHTSICYQGITRTSILVEIVSICSTKI